MKVARKHLARKAAIKRYEAAYHKLAGDNSWAGMGCMFESSLTTISKTIRHVPELKNAAPD